MSWQPPKTVYLDVIKSQNPWWPLGRVPEEHAKRIARPLGASLWKALKRPRIRYQLVLGPRRVGKTTAMYQTVQRLIDEGVDPHRLAWLTLNQPYLMEASLGAWVRKLIDAHGSSLTQKEPLFLFLDEVNYAEKWDLWLKTFYDEKWPIRLVATSSSTAALRDRQFESGVGRWEDQYLSPCLFGEYLGLVNEWQPRTNAKSLREAIKQSPSAPSGNESLAESLRRFLLIGGYPELVMQPKGPDEVSEVLRSQHVLRSDAIQRAVCMDIPQVFNVNEPIKLERLLYILAGQIGGIVSPNSIATDLALTPPTIHQYLDYLERAFLIFLLPNYSKSEESIQRRGRKVYFVDGALRNAALHRGIAPTEDHAEMGVLLENAAAAHLNALALQTGVRLFHWKQGRHEVDLIYDHPSEPMAFEVTASAKHKLEGLRALAERYPAFRGQCYLVSTNRMFLLPSESPDGIGRVPFDQFLLSASALAGAELDRRLGF